MKQFLIWLVVFWGLFAGLSVYYHLDYSAHPVKILVAVDESYKMQSVSPVKLKAAINAIKNKRYAQFSLITTKRNVHGWQAELAWDSLQAYGPRDLESLRNDRLFPQVKEARELYVITNAADLSGLSGLPHLHTIRLEPSSP